MLIAAIITYASAMTLANLSIATFGVWVSPINAFLFIGLDLALRDWLQMQIKAWQMAVLIAVSGGLTYALNQDVAGAAVDSIAFPTIAFGVFMPEIVALQFLAKIAGGAVWTYLLGKIK